MLIVKVEVWPRGRASEAREIGRIGAANVSALSAVSDYVAVLRDDTGRSSAVRLTGHPRDAGFWPLLARLASSQLETDDGADGIPEWQEVAEQIGERMYSDGW